MEAVKWVQEHATELISIYCGIVTVASIVVKLTPTQADDAILGKVVAFVSKYLALNPEKKS